MSTLQKYKVRKSLGKRLRKEVLDSNDGLCYYCQLAKATEIDHVIPYSYSQNHNRDNLVPSCHSCNSIVGDMVFSSLEEKAQYIRKQLRKRKWIKRHNRINTCPDCGESFQPGVNGATNLLCGYCARLVT